MMYDIQSLHAQVPTKVECEVYACAGINSPVITRHDSTQSTCARTFEAIIWAWRNPNEYDVRQRIWEGVCYCRVRQSIAPPILSISPRTFVNRGFILEIDKTPMVSILKNWESDKIKFCFWPSGVYSIEDVLNGNLNQAFPAHSPEIAGAANTTSNSRGQYKLMRWMIQVWDAVSTCIYPVQTVRFRRAVTQCNRA